MSAFFCLKSFKKHKALIWNICWSLFGDFLISCGTDGIILIWGPCIGCKLIDSILKKKDELLNFSLWTNICAIESFSKFRTYKNIKWANKFNFFCAVSFSGFSFMFNIIFQSGFKRQVYLQIQDMLLGPKCELKNCDFIRSGKFVSIVGRNKLIYIWKKNLREKYSCFFIIKYNKSDIKCIKWYMDHQHIITSSYNGELKIFFKKKKGIQLQRINVLCEFNNMVNRFLSNWTSASVLFE